MKKKEKLINHGLMRFLLFALVLLMPIGAWAQDENYELWVCGRQVTSANASNVFNSLNDKGEPTVVFEASSNQLTLNGFIIDIDDGIVIESQLPDLTVFLTGINSITCGGDNTFAFKGNGGKVNFATATYAIGGLTLSVEAEENIFNNITPSYSNGLSFFNVPNSNAYKIDHSLGGDGSDSSTPYVISSYVDLVFFAQRYNDGSSDLQRGCYVELGADIDCTNMSGFEPIGISPGAPFWGYFNGKDHKISNLTYTATTQQKYAGLFGVFGWYDDGSSSSYVKNLVLENCNFTGLDKAGAIAGDFESGQIINCTVNNCTVTGTGDCTKCGGVAGYVDCGSITSCRVTGSTEVNYEGDVDPQYVGAIVGDYDDGAALTGNYYDYTVTTTTSNGIDYFTKDVYQMRGTGFDIDIFTDDGAVMYTKLVTLPGDIAEGCSVEGGEERYFRENADYGTEMYIAPGEDASLTVIAAQGYYPESVKVTYGTTTIDATFDNQSGNYYYYSFKMPDENATVSVTVANGDSYPLFIGNTQVTSANKDDVLDDGGTVKFTSVMGQNQEPVYTLTLNNAAITAPVKVGLDNLTFDIQGTNTITTTATCLQAMDNTTPMLTFKSTSDVVGKLMLTSTQGYVSNIDNVTASKELAPIIPNSGAVATGGYSSDFYYWRNGVSEAKFLPSYGVQLYDVFITPENTTNVFGDGTVSFDKDNHTLTLNNASVSYSDFGSVSTWLPELTIDVVGNNMLSSGSYATLQSLYDTDVTVTVQSSGTTKGCLVLKMGASSTNRFAGNRVTLNITSPLEIVSGDLTANEGNLNVVTIGVPVDYKLMVEDIRVVAANASNITNGASFDAATNTLTLDNSYFSYYWLGSKVPIQSDIEDLTVKLVGNNTVTLGSKVFEFIGISNTTPQLTFVSEVVEGQYGSLTINGTTSTDAIANGYQIANNLTNNQSASGLIYALGDNSIKLWSQESYGIVVTKGDVSYLINSANSDNVLRDNPTAPSVLFDGYNRLVLNNADLTSIVVNAVNSLPAKGLDIYLEGNSKITNPAGYAISYEVADAVRGLTFHTGCDAPGTLVCTNSTPVTFTPFGGFNQSYFNNLAQFVDDNKVTVKIPLGLIVDASTTVTSLIFDSNPAGRDDAPLDNVAFNNVLYTLADNGTPASEDGFDQDRSLVVVNSLMTDELVRAIDTKQCVPSSDEYQRRFKGLTFVVPAGTGTIKLKLMTEYPGSYAFHVMVDYQDPVEIIPTATLAEYTVNYACSDVSYVKVYLVALDAPTPALHRAGPKATISGGIGGMTVSSSLVTSPPSAGLQYRVMGVDDFMQRGNHIDVDATDVTDLPENAFGFGGSPAPAMGSNRVAPSGHITYIDVSKTSITGKDFKRTEGAFVGVPDETLIFLPAGNTAEGKNFIIGGICDDMAPLNAASEKEFEVATDFIAAKAEYDRVFTQNATNDECYTVFLPYAVELNDAVGEFFTYGGFDGTTVTLNKVVAPSDNGGLTTPNTPYIFKPAQTGVLEAMMNAAVKKLPDTYVEADPDDESEAEGLHGVYEYHKWNTKPANVYCYSAYEKNGIKAGEFAKVGEGTHIKPFRAYLRINATSAPESLSINWGDGTTSIIPLDKSQVQQDADGWYTISGFRLPGKPTEKGLYVNGGKKVVIK